MLSRKKGGLFTCDRASGSEADKAQHGNSQEGGQDRASYDSRTNANSRNKKGWVEVLSASIAHQTGRGSGTIEVTYTWYPDKLFEEVYDRWWRGKES